MITLDTTRGQGYIRFCPVILLLLPGNSPGCRVVDHTLYPLRRVFYWARALGIVKNFIEHEGVHLWVQEKMPGGWGSGYLHILYPL